MKKIFTLCIIAFAALFCYNKCAKFKANILKYEREKFVADSIARREAFIADSLEHLDAVKSIKGLGQIYIGNTFEQVKNDFDRNSNSRMRYQYFGYGHWDYRVLDLDCSKYIYDNTTNIKEYTVKDYKIGVIEIKRVSCAFYKDKLVAISFECSDEILNHYIEKYGRGKEVLHQGEVIRRTWSNENITLDYISFSSECIISSNSEYNKFLEELEKYETQYKIENNQKKQSSLNQL